MLKKPLSQEKEKGKKLTQRTFLGGSGTNKKSNFLYLKVLDLT